MLPLVHSTALYPEWALVALPGVSKLVCKQVAAGLLSPDVEESQFRWEMPYGYKPVRQLMEQTQTPPFDTDFSWRDVASRYSAWLIASGLMFGVILALLIRQYRSSFLLNHSRSRLQAIFDQAGEGIFLHSYTGEIHDVNAYGLAMFNVENRQQMSEMASDFIVPEDLVVFEQAMNEVRKSGSTMFEIGCRHVDGSLFPVEVVSRRVKFGRNIFVQSIVRDISVRKQAELRMQKFFKAMEASKEAVLLTDKDGMIEYVNPAFEEVTGYSSDEAIGQKPSMLKSGEQSPSFYARLWSAIAGGHAWHGRMVERKKDGSFYPAYVSISHILQGKEVVGYVGTHYDLTVQEKTEESLSKAQKMEAVGSLVAGIAHEFNNILAGMVGNLFLARRRLPDANHAAVEKIAKAEQLAKKATDMIAQLMVFSHKAPVEKKSIPFDVFLKEAAKLCQLSVPEDMMFSWHCHDEDLNVHGDPVLLQQVMVNLVNNAKHALEGCEHPEVRLNCEKFHPDNDFRMEYPQLDARDYVHVQVQDNGCGISSEHLSNIFEPFFTTKEPVVGTGLGLAMVKGTIESHQGRVRLESEPGRGTTVHIYLPLIEGHPVESLDKDVEAMYPGKGETILLVDDDSMVLETMHEVLDQLGYKSLLASDGDEALAMLKVRKDDIQLIISDVVMPHCNGDRLLTTMRQQGITIPVIFTTGYSPDRFEQIRAQGMGEELVMLSNPVNFDELAKVIRQQLETVDRA